MIRVEIKEGKEAPPLKRVTIREPANELIKPSVMESSAQKSTREKSEKSAKVEPEKSSIELNKSSIQPEIAPKKPRSKRIQIVEVDSETPPSGEDRLKEAEKMEVDEEKADGKGEKIEISTEDVDAVKALVVDDDGYRSKSKGK